VTASSVAEACSTWSATWSPVPSAEIWKSFKTALYTPQRSSPDAVKRYLKRIAAIDGAEVGWRARTTLRAAVQTAACWTNEPRWQRKTLIARLRTAEGLSVARAALERGDWNAAHVALQQHVMHRGSSFVLRPSNRGRVAASITKAYPTARADAAIRADRLLTGVRDVLGYQGVRFDGWHHDPVSRRYAPRAVWHRVPYLDPAFGDHKVIWEVNRHQHWLTWGRAYWLTGEDKYRDAVVDELASWMHANPPLIGINWASMLELSLRSLSWVWALHFFARAEARDDREPWLVDLLLGLDTQLTHVEQNLSYFFSPNAHLLGEALALYVAGLAVPELAASPDRAALGRRLLIVEAARQVAPDGVHRERSTHYHRYTLDFYLLALAVARASGDPIAAAFERIVTRLSAAARALADDDGRAPLIGDDDGGMLMPIAGRRPDDWRDSLAAASALTGRPDFAIGAPPEEAAWMTGIVPLSPAARPGRDARVGSLALSDSGYYISRSHGRHHLIIDGGPHGYLNGGHAHADALAITLSVRNTPLLIDPGTACYTTDARVRDRFRSTLAHNTLQVDGVSQSTCAGPFHWSRTSNAITHRWRSTGGFDLFDGSHDGYAPVTHRRRVLTIHEQLIVIADAVLGQGEHRADVHWHLSDRWGVQIAGRVVELTTPEDRVRLVVPQGRIESFRGDATTGLGWYSPAYGRVLPTTTLRLTHSGPTPFAMAGVFDLNPADPIEEVEWLPVWSEAGAVAQSSALKVSRRESSECVLFVEPARPSTHGRWRIGEFETDARVLYHRVDRSGKVTCLALADGSYVRSNGRRAFALTLGRLVPALLIDAFTIGTYTPCAASPGF